MGGSEAQGEWTSSSIPWGTLASVDGVTSTPGVPDSLPVSRDTGIPQLVFTGWPGRPLYLRPASSTRQCPGGRVLSACLFRSPNQQASPAATAHWDALLKGHSHGHSQQVTRRRGLRPGPTVRRPTPVPGGGLARVQLLPRAQEPTPRPAHSLKPNSCWQLPSWVPRTWGQRTSSQGHHPLYLSGSGACRTQDQPSPPRCSLPASLPPPQRPPSPPAPPPHPSLFSLSSPPLPLPLPF